LTREGGGTVPVAGEESAAVAEVFRAYETLVARADRAFARVAGEYGALVRCRAGCDDCCHAVFGLFLIESVSLAYHVRSLEGKQKEAAAENARRFDSGLAAVLAGHQAGAGGALGRARARCPLLGDDRRCLVYAGRPLTCRVYGIPTAIGGRGHVCGRSGVAKGGSYPTFNLDAANRELHRLSGRLLAAIGREGLDDRVLYAVSRSLTLSPAELLMPGVPGGRRGPAV